MAPRKPQDHQSKATPAPAGPFTFEHRGEEYTLADHADVLTAGFARRTRNLDAAGQLFTLLELLADEEALEAIDEMNLAEWQDFQHAFAKHTGYNAGE